MSSASTTCQVPGDRRIEPPERAVTERVADSAEVDLGYDEPQARAEAERCLASLACTYCEVCQLICPDLCITRDAASGHIVLDLAYCKGCGLCAHYCPKGAIEMVME